jgi:peptide/nickel transport system permease protein
MIPTFIGITLVCFMLLRVIPDNPMKADGRASTGAALSQEAVDQLRAVYDLDKPWYVQYGRLTSSLLTLDLGTRWQDGRPIADVVKEALPITLLLSCLSLLLSYLIAIPLGVYSAVRHGTLFDRLSTLLVLALYSLPPFWVAMMLLTFLSSDRYLECAWSAPGSGCFPLQGWHSFAGFDAMSLEEKLRDVAWHLVLPLVALTYNGVAATSRYVRTALLENIHEDYVRTARAKGLAERVVIWKHALANSLLPSITMLGLTLPDLIAGSAVVELIFGIPGMGYELLNALRLPDYPQVISLVAFTALLTMVGTLLSDILYAMVDPRIRVSEDDRA